MSSKEAFSIRVSAGWVNRVVDKRPVGERYVYEVVISVTSLKIFSYFFDPSAPTLSKVIDM